MIDFIQCLVAVNALVTVMLEILLGMFFVFVVLTTEPSAHARDELRGPLLGLMVIPAWPVALAFALRDRIHEWNAYNRDRRNQYGFGKDRT